MTTKEIAKKMLPYNVFGVLFLVVGVIKSHGFFAVVPLCFTLTWTILLILAAKKMRSSKHKNSEE